MKVKNGGLLLMEVKNLPNVPDPEIVSIGEEEIPRQIGEEFFGRILSFLGYNEKNVSRYARCEMGSLILLGVGDPLYKIHKVTVLTVKGIPVAQVTYWRDQPKYTCVIYSHNLNENVIKRSQYQKSRLAI